jgi:hypothetical protein
LEESIVMLSRACALSLSLRRRVGTAREQLITINQLRSAIGLRRNAWKMCR